MKIFKRINFYKRPDESISEEIRENNIQRMLYFSLIVIPVTLYHIVLFYINLAPPGTPDYQWGLGIIVCHSYALVFFIAAGIFFYHHRRHNRMKNRTIDILFILVFFQMIILGVALVVFDQIVTPAITPYLVLCAIISLIILIPPAYSIPIYFISYILFFFGIEIFQQKPEVILSNRVNGITAISLGILFSIIMWRNTITRYRQRNIIEKQKRELEKKLLELQDANTSKDKLFGIIAHDLTTPFNLITGLSEFLKENVRDYSTEQIEKHLTDIHRTSFQTQSLLQELLIWARMQTGNILFNPVQFDLYPTCKDVTDTIFPVSSAKGISIEINIEGSINLLADMEMVKTILRNLVANAIKYSQPESRIIIRAMQKDLIALIEVEDTGVGMTTDEVKQLFSSVGTKSTPGTSNEKGSGLGLIICKDFVEKCGGKIWVESTMEKGSIFSFTLPVAP
jgi:signal transduction histidine kinase